MEAGRSIEFNEHRFAKEAGILLDHNVKARKVYPSGITISAEIDAVYDYAGEKSIIEIKSFAGYVAKRGIFGNTRVVGRPKDDHILQGALYLDIYPYPETVFRYIDRESMDVVEHSISLSPVTVGGSTIHIVKLNGSLEPDFSLERIIDRYVALDRMISSDILPARDYSPVETSKKRGVRTRSWQCSYCQWLSRCLSDGPSVC